MAIPGLLKITVFWSKGYEDIIPVDDVINKTLSRELNYIADVFMFMWSLVTVAFLWESLFFRSGLGSSSIIWDWH